MTFLVALDTRPAMLLSVAKHVSDRSLAFAVLDKIDAEAPNFALATIDSPALIEVLVDLYGIAIFDYDDIPF